MRSTFIIIAGILLTAGLGAVNSQSALAQDESAGRSLFIEFGCWQCHGYEGQGGASGPRVAPTMLPFVAFEQFVRRPVNVMPAYTKGNLSDEALRAIYDFLGDVEEPPAIEDIPELR